MNLYNLDHELKLLSSVIYDVSTFDEIPVSAEDFYDSRHATIFKTIGQIIRDGQRPDLPLLVDKCRGIEQSYWAKIEPMTAANIQFYVDSVLHFSQLRKLSNVGNTVWDSIATGRDPGEIVEALEVALTNLSTGTKKVESLKDLLGNSLQQIEDNYNNRGKLPGVPTGFDKLDFLTGGLQKGEFIVIGARPSIGKTAFALGMSRAAAGAGFPVGFFSLEQSQSPQRLLAAESSVNIVNMRTGYLVSGDFNRLVDGCTKLSNLPIYFDHHSYKLADIRSQARRLVRMGCKVLFIDYLTLIHFGNSSMRTFERVGEISHSLKLMARELDVPLVVLSQLSREAEGKRPTLAELRMSGEIEQDADMVIFLHRSRKAETYETIVDVAKQRNGPVEEFVVMFVPAFTKFTDLGVA